MLFKSHSAEEEVRIVTLLNLDGYQFLCHGFLIHLEAL